MAITLPANHLPKPLAKANARLLLGTAIRSRHLGLARRWFDTLGKVMPVTPGTRIGWSELGGLRTLIVEHPDADPTAAILYMHGGGYRMNTPNTYRGLTSRLSQAARARVYVPTYRLAPEHSCPAPIEDALTAFRALVEREEHSAERIVIAGDSAGGGITVATAVALRDAGDALPGRLGLIEPWVDLTHSGRSVEANKKTEPVLSPETSRVYAAEYAGALPLDDPRVSPLFANLEGLPPVVLQTAGDDILLSEGQDLARRLHEAGVDVDHHSFPGVWHVFQGMTGTLREADEALDELGAKLRPTFS